ncbi:MAG: hypothetical protein FWH55_09730 [Oscillospiraceae bacterium]|nr:hypothetical protein [Oscillospiraceae bacterium]MCL2164651.1 hypothetical protein [Oscillospiraceae bacterium]
MNDLSSDMEQEADSSTAQIDSAANSDNATRNNSVERNDNRAARGGNAARNGNAARGANVVFCIIDGKNTGLDFITLRIQDAFRQA